jgi:hypothetical protein
MIDSIFAKYKVPNDYPKNPLGTLYFILRKAELAKDLLHSEWEWLKSQSLAATIEVIKTQEENRKVIAEYREVISNDIRRDLVTLRKNKYVSSSILTIPSVESERALVFYKVHNQESLSESEWDYVKTEYNSLLSFLKLKNKYGITEDIEFDAYSTKRLSMIERGHSLSSQDYGWLHFNSITSALNLIATQAKALTNKYETDLTLLPPIDKLKLLYILQKIEESIIPNDEEQQFLIKNSFNYAYQTAQVKEFIALKSKYQATSFESNDPSQHLYKVLKKIDSAKPLTEPDVNYLKKRKLNETLKFAYKPYADELRSKVLSGEVLSDQEVEWCNTHNYFEIPFLAILLAYGIRDDEKYSVDCPLYNILQKLNSEQRLSDEDVIWLEGEKLLRPGSKIYIAHHRLAALHFEEEFKRTKGYWNVVNASAHWRKADEPKTALKLTNNLQQLRTLKEAKLKSALFTTRGGALRDIDHLSDAETCASEAIRHYADSHNPYTLMGALCYDTGRYELGDEWFEKAVKLGAKIKDQDAELKRILSKKKGKELQDIIDHLVKKDPERFKWVKQYAKK